MDSQQVNEKKRQFTAQHIDHEITPQQAVVSTNCNDTETNTQNSVVSNNNQNNDFQTRYLIPMIETLSTNIIEMSRTLKKIDSRQENIMLFPPHNMQPQNIPPQPVFNKPIQVVEVENIQSGPDVIDPEQSYQISQTDKKTLVKLFNCHSDRELVLYSNFQRLLNEKLNIPYGENWLEKKEHFNLYSFILTNVTNPSVFKKDKDLLTTIWRKHLVDNRITYLSIFRTINYLELYKDGEHLNECFDNFKKKYKKEFADKQIYPLIKFVKRNKEEKDSISKTKEKDSISNEKEKDSDSDEKESDENPKEKNSDGKTCKIITNRINNDLSQFIFQLHANIMNIYTDIHDKELNKPLKLNLVPKLWEEAISAGNKIEITKNVNISKKNSKNISKN